jgi:precorrin-4/cobalt-precorrin-4 C11-methyltransferase
MGKGRVTFITVTPDPFSPLSWRARKAVNDADIVIWDGGVVQDNLLLHASEHADVVVADPGSIDSLLPFYDLASRDGFLVVNIRSTIPVRWEHIFEQIERCDELGVKTELVRS